MRFCIWLPAFIASSADGNVDMTSSPIVLITEPPYCSVASFMMSTHFLHRFTGTLVPQRLVELGTAYDVRKQDGDMGFTGCAFYVAGHSLRIEVQPRLCHIIPVVTLAAYFSATI